MQISGRSAAPMALVQHQHNRQQPLFQAVALPRLSRHAPARKASRCQAQQENKADVAKFADSIGLPTEEGIFGFKPFPEVWVGRLAMAGFFTAIVEEFITGKGPLGQIGLIVPSPDLAVFILAAATGATFLGIIQTVVKAQSGDLSARDAQRYRQFLGLNKEDQNIQESEGSLKGRNDPVRTSLAPTSDQEADDISDSRRQGTPADRVLDYSDKAEADMEQGKSPVGTIDKEQYRSAGPNMSLSAKQDELERQNFANNPTMAYARDVEITNGRWAMIGFLSAITVEAATGKGILSQCLWYAKLVGLLGKDSGFY